jgi:hypothetical protein
MLPINQEGAIYCEISYGIMVNMWRFEDESSQAYVLAKYKNTTITGNSKPIENSALKS